jgi:hypothetical protein
VLQRRFDKLEQASRQWYSASGFQLRSFVGRSELRLSLYARSVRLTERRALACHAYLHRLRHIVRLLKSKMRIEEEDASKVLADLSAELQEQLEQLRREVPVQQELAILAPIGDVNTATDTETIEELNDRGTEGKQPT